MGTKPQKTDIVDLTIQKVKELQQASALQLPPDYNAVAALKAAQVMLSEPDREGRAILDKCTRKSVYLALLKMVTQGLDPIRNQCYFIAYKDTVQCMRSYFGSVALARRFGLKEIWAYVIYQGDLVSIETFPDEKRKIHVVHKFENMDITKIAGAYCVIEMEDGTQYSEVMTMQQINQAWMKSRQYKQGAQAEFPDEMAKRTVVNRALKWIINTYITDDVDVTLSSDVEEGTATVILEDDPIPEPVLPSEPTPKQYPQRGEEEPLNPELAF